KIFARRANFPTARVFPSPREERVGRGTGRGAVTRDAPPLPCPSPALSSIGWGEGGISVPAGRLCLPGQAASLPAQSRCGSTSGQRGRHHVKRCNARAELPRKRDGMRKHLQETPAHMPPQSRSAEESFSVPCAESRKHKQSSAIFGLASA